MVGIARPVVKLVSDVQRLLDAIPVWKRAEVRLTFALSDGRVEDIARALKLDREAVYLITRLNPVDDPRRHWEMGRGSAGVAFAKEGYFADRRFSGSTAVLAERWEAAIEEVKQKSEGNCLIDVAALTDEIANAINPERRLNEAAAAVVPAQRVAVRLAFAVNPRLGAAEIADALGMDAIIVQRLTRRAERSSDPINRGDAGIQETKGMFMSEQAVGRGSPVRDEAGWLAALVTVRATKNRLLKDLDWRLVDLAAQAKGLGNPLLVSLEAPR
ncbi:MAG: hypothetical protein COW30_16060 [Rhodospirillales bacterium CG15_BIG_FIL_POST_REV_8_21_14_020_66_15]|nr:MAG: hypothetical protein COW30_16060 [Rhodospirillales bacterium CG15_BIG_FIL_POST_REV_8_21_14_020_66_15]